MIFHNYNNYLSFFLHSILWLTCGYTAYSESTSPTCNINIEDENFIPLMQEYIKKKEFIKAEGCLKQKHSKSPNNQDVTSFLVRVLSWQKKFIEAKKILDKWEPKNFQHNILQGDFYWYQGKCNAARKYYIKAQKQKSFKDFPKNSATNHIKCLDIIISQLQKKSSQKWDQLQQKFPDVHAPKIKESKTNDSSKISLMTQYLNYIQSENQSSREYLFEINLKHGSTRYNLSLTDILRDFNESILNDQILALEVNYKSTNSHQIRIRINHSLDPQFSYSNSLELGYAHQLSKYNIGLNLRYTIYKNFSTQLYSPFLTASINPFIFSLHGYFGIGNINSASSLLNIKILTNNFTTGVWVSSGTEESSRPYFINSEVSEFLSYGAKLQWSYKNKIKPFFLIEKRAEIKFHQTLISLGGLWKL